MPRSIAKPRAGNWRTSVREGGETWSGRENARGRSWKGQEGGFSQRTDKYLKGKVSYSELPRLRVDDKSAPAIPPNVHSGSTSAMSLCEPRGIRSTQVRETKPQLTSRVISTIVPQPHFETLRCVEGSSEVARTKLRKSKSISAPFPHNSGNPRSRTVHSPGFWKRTPPPSRTRSRTPSTFCFFAGSSAEGARNGQLPSVCRSRSLLTQTSRDKTKSTGCRTSL